MFWRKSERHAALVAQLDEVRRLERALREEDPVVRDHADRVAVDVGEAADERRAVLGLELVQAAAVDDPGDDLARVVGRSRVGRDRAVERLGVDRRRLDRRALPGARRARRERRDHRAQDAQRVLVVGREVVDDA